MLPGPEMGPERVRLKGEVDGTLTVESLARVIGPVQVACNPLSAPDRPSIVSPAPFKVSGSARVALETNRVAPLLTVVPLPLLPRPKSSSTRRVPALTVVSP